MLSWIRGTLAIAIVAMLFWPRQCPAAVTPAHTVTHVEPGHIVLQTERPATKDVKRTGLCALHVEFCKYRGLYRQVGVPFLILSLIVLPGWLMFRLYRRRTSGHRVSARRELLLLTFVVYLICLATLTLTPNRSERLRAEARGGIELQPNLATLTCSSALLSSGSNVRSFCKQNAVGNVLLFFPLGVLALLVWKQLGFWRVIVIALALSLGIELMQYFSSAWGSYRSADVNDVILNVFGAFLGLVLVYLPRALSTRAHDRNPAASM